MGSLITDARDIVLTLIVSAIVSNLAVVSMIIWKTLARVCMDEISTVASIFARIGLAMVNFQLTVLTIEVLRTSTISENSLKIFITLTSV